MINQILKLIKNDVMIVKPAEIKKVLLHDFKDLYCTTEGLTPLSLVNLD